jgi:hypothetical protein
MDEPSAPVEPPPLSPWAAPTVPSAPAVPSAPTISVVIPEPPRRSHRVLVAAVVVLIVAGLGVGAFFILTGGDDAITFALDVAAERAADAPGQTNHIETTALGQSLAIDGTVDNETHLIEMQMDLGAMLGTDATIKAVVDPENKVMYMATEGFGDAIKEVTDKKWVRIDQQAVNDAGQDGSMFDQLGSAGQVDVNAVLDGAKKVTDRGLTTFEGEKLRHYEVVVVVKDVKGLTDILEHQSAGIDATLPDEITYDLYVSKDNEIRRIAYDVDLGVAKATVDITQHMLDTAPGIERPPDDEVVDITDLG